MGAYAEGICRFFSVYSATFFLAPLTVRELRDGSKFMGNPGRVYRQGGKDFFRAKKRGQVLFLEEKKGGEFFFGPKKRGANFFFQEKKGGQKVFFGSVNWGVNTFLVEKRGGQRVFYSNK